MSTPEIKTKPSNRHEQDHFLYLSASLSDLLDAHDEMEARFRLIPNGWRDLRLTIAVMSRLLERLALTYEPVKRQQMHRMAERMTHKLVVGPQVTHDEEQYVIGAHDFGILLESCADKCAMCMASPQDCKGCDLCKALDRLSFISRQNRAWWEVFKRSERTDIGEDPGYGQS